MLDKKAYTVFSFHKQLNEAFRNRRELLEKALPVLRDLFKLDRVYFFDWQIDRGLLSLKMMCKKEYCMDMQEDISLINEPDFLKDLLQKGLVDSDLSYPAVYLLLKWQRPSMDLKDGEVKKVMEDKIGVFRLERFRKNRKFTEAERDLLKALGLEISHNLANTEVDQAKEQSLGVATALNELANIFASSLRLTDGLELILKGVQRYFRFDRVRLYLTNYDGSKIKTILGVDISGEVSRESGDDLPENEKHLLQKVFESNSMFKMKQSVMYIPLQVQRNKVGFLTFDNLLSRRRIGFLDYLSIRQFATQISLSIDNAALFERVQELSNYDELTKLPVRRFFNEKFEDEIYRSKRFDLTMSLIIMDIDLFKQINDNYGHQIGDYALKEISKVIRTSLRQTDFPCRYGGDEMVIMLPRTNGDEAQIIAKRLKDRVHAIKIPERYTDGKDVHLSISQGIAVFPTDAETSSDLFEKADKALYWVKNGHRGTFAVYHSVADQLPQDKPKKEKGNGK